MEQALYHSIGVGYNSTRRADPFLTERLYTLLSPRKNFNCLDVGCGTGNHTIALASRGVGAFYGVEPSQNYARNGKAKKRFRFLDGRLCGKFAVCK